MKVPRTLPNLLSLLRVALGAAFLYLLLAGRTMPALGLFLAAMLTDAADGFVARRWKLGSRTGIVLDGAADKLVLAGGFLVLTLAGRVPAWVGWSVLAYHAFTVLVFAFGLLAKRGVHEHAPAARAGGVLQTATVALALVLPAQSPWLLALATVTVAVLAIAVLAYARTAMKSLGRL